MDGIDVLICVQQSKVKLTDGRKTAHDENMMPILSPSESQPQLSPHGMNVMMHNTHAENRYIWSCPTNISAKVTKHEHGPTLKHDIYLCQQIHMCLHIFQTTHADQAPIREYVNVCTIQTKYKHFAWCCDHATEVQW